MKNLLESITTTSGYKFTHIELNTGVLSNKYSLIIDLDKTDNHIYFDFIEFNPNLTSIMLCDNNGGIRKAYKLDADSYTYLSREMSLIELGM